MTYEQYWYGDVWMVGAFRKLDKLKRDRDNYNAWLLGGYVYEAISRLTPVLHAFAKSGTKPEPYLEKPFSYKEQDTELDEETEKNYALAYMTNMVRAGKSWGKKGGG